MRKMIVMNTPILATIKHYKGNEIFTVHPVGNKSYLPTFWDLSFRLLKIEQAKKARFVGAGIYVIGYDGVPLYIGKFLGQKNKPVAGDIRTARWAKHLATLTNRGQNLSFSFTARREIGEITPQSDLLSKILEVNPAVMAHDRGCQSTYNRFKFALQHWETFSGNLCDIQLSKFQFTYIKLESMRLEAISVSVVRELISLTEKQLVSKLMPPCNTTSKKEINTSTLKSERCIEDYSMLVQAALQVAFNGDLVKQKVGTPMKTQNPTTKLDFSEPEDVCNETLFEERLEGADQFILTFVDDVRSTYSVKNNIQIHYARLNGGQMRLRVFAPGVRSAGQNFATFTYRPQKKILVMNVKSDSPESISLNKISGSGALNVGVEITPELSNDQKAEALMLLTRSMYLISGDSKDKLLHETNNLRHLRSP